MRKRLTIPLLLATVSSTLLIPTQANAQDTSNQCSKVHVITVAGTGSSSTKASTDGSSDFIVKGLTEKYGSDITSYNLPYPSSAGAVESIWNIKTDINTTYGDSRLIGDETGLNHIEQYRDKCPDSKILLTGYSQGAHVAGDIAALIANGALDNTTSDDILAAYLFADPGRSGNSAYTGSSKANTSYFALPEGAQYNRNGEYTTNTKDNRIGMTGQRSLPFTGLEGRIFSLCHDDDIACSVDIGGVIRAGADTSDKKIIVNEAYRNGISASEIFLNNGGKLLPILLESGFLDVLKSGATIDEAIEKARPSLVKSDIPDDQKHVINNMFKEIEDVVKALHREDAYGANVTDGQIIGNIVRQVAPNIDKFDLPFKPEEIQAAKNIIPIVTSILPDVPADISQRMKPIAESIISFLPYHSSYWRMVQNDSGAPGHQIGNVTSATWAKNNAIDGVGRYLTGVEPYAVSTDANNTQREIAEPDRADDGLRGLLNGETREVLPNESILNDDEENTSPSSTRKPPAPTNDITTITPEEDVSVALEDYLDDSDKEEENTSEEITVNDDYSSEDTVSTVSNTPTVSNIHNATATGPQVDTGGNITLNFIAKLKAIF